MEENDDAKIKYRGTLQSIAMLLNVNEAECEKALCSRVVAARGEVVDKGHTIEQAITARDALAKVRGYCCGISMYSFVPSANRNEQCNVF